MWPRSLHVLGKLLFQPWGQWHLSGSKCDLLLVLLLLTVLLQLFYLEVTNKLFLWMFQLSWSYIKLISLYMWKSPRWGYNSRSVSNQTSSRFSFLRWCVSTTTDQSNIMERMFRPCHDRYFRRGQWPVIRNNLILSLLRFWVFGCFNPLLIL